MGIVLIAINNAKRIYFNSSVGLGIIYEYLAQHGHKPECINYFIDLSHEFYFIEYSGYVPELIDLPAALIMLKNFQKKDCDLLKGITSLTRIQLKNLKNLRDSFDRIPVPDNSVFGFSVLSVSFLYSIYCALLLRKRNPNVKIVFGNYHVSLSQHVRDFVLKSGIADIVVIGDGCEPMLRIARGEISQGVVTGEFRKNIIWPLDYYTRLDFTNGNYMSMTSVGCPLRCYFCASNRENVLYSLQDFEEYLKKLVVKIKVRSIHLVDDEINPSLSRAIQVCGIMKKIGIPWSCFLTPQNITKELAVSLKDSSCSRVFVGTDSFCDERLKYINKPTTAEQNLRSLYALAEQGLRFTVSSILGFPYETKKERKLTVEVYNNIKKRFGKQVYACFSLFKVTPGSYFYSNAAAYGIKFLYWKDAFQEIIPELRDIVRATPERFCIPQSNRNQAIRIMKKFNNFVSEDRTKIHFKEVRLSMGNSNNL